MYGSLRARGRSAHQSRSCIGWTLMGAAVFALILAVLLAPGVSMAQSGLETASMQVGALSDSDGSGNASNEAAQTRKQKYEKALADFNALDAERVTRQSAVDTAKQAYNAAVQKKQVADTALAEKKAAVTAAEQALASARASKSAAATGQTTAETNLTNATNAVSAAQAALTTATSQKQEADSAVAAAQKKVDDAQAALEAAQEQIAKGSFGFFESVGATAAINALNRVGFNNVQKNPSTGADSGKRFTDYVKKGDAKDATALDSMKNSIEWIKYANAIREEAGLSAFKVTDELMASAQANADFSSVIYNHASNYGSDLRNNAENLFKANITVERAYQGWYYSEKQIFDNAVAQDPTLEQYRYDAYGLYMANPQVYYNVGHYLNFIWPNSTLTGIGLCYNNGTASIQHFAGSSYGELTFTVEEYETRFMNYYDSVKGAPEQALADAQAELVAAQGVQTEKATALKNAEANVATAQGEEASARDALAQAQQAVMDAANQETVAQGNLTAANQAVPAAEQEVVAAEQDAQQKRGALDTAQAALDQLQPSLEAAQQALDAAKADYEAEVAATVQKGKTYQVSKQSYKVTKVASGSKAGVVVFTKAKNVKSVSVPATVEMADGKTYNVTQVGAKAFTGKAIRTVTVGKNVSKLVANAFNKSNATTLKLKTTKLNKAGVKGCLKGSKVKTVQAPASKRAAYKKIFTKAVAGKKVTVK